MMFFGSYDIEELRADATILVGETYNGSNKLGTSIYANDSYLHSDNLDTIQVNQPETYTVTKQVSNVEVEGQKYKSNFANYTVRGEFAFEKYDIDGEKVHLFLS